LNIGLYVDVHVPSAVTYALRLRDLDVLTAQEDGADQFSDAALLDALQTEHGYFFRRTMIYSAKRPCDSGVGNLSLD